MNTPGASSQLYIDKTIIVKVLKTREESSRVTTLTLGVENYPVTKPGQFVMIWVPEKEEIPMAISDQGKGWINISVDNVGDTTSYLSSLERGALLGVRGPFGSCFDLESGKKYLVAGSGCGVSPLHFAVKKLSEINKPYDVVIDARNREELCFFEKISNFGVKPFLSTHDNSIGFGGYGSLLVETMLENTDYDYVISCGPELMLKEIHNICLKKKIRFQASLERHMKCGIGLCGSCVLDPSGLLVCKDGPVFNGETLSKITDFGKWRRAKDGAIKRI
jgi:dihydroorotate dehydrogenase electron transfer subunit